MKDDEHEAYGAMIFRGKTELSVRARVLRDEAARLRAQADRIEAIAAALEGAQKSLDLVHALNKGAALAVARKAAGDANDRRCKNCKCWAKEPACNENGPQNFRECLNEGGPQIMQMNDAPGWGRASGVATEPDFGCVNFCALANKGGA